MAANSSLQITLQPMRQQTGLRKSDRDWTGLTNASERRRMQNRLNQRAYYQRRKLRTKHIQLPEAGQTGRLLTRTCFLNHVSAHQQTMRLAQQAMQEYLTHNYDLCRLSPLVRLNVFFAWLENARIMGMAESWLTEGIVSPFYGGAELGPRDISGSLPDALRPTATQRMVRHHPWIDVLPHPQLRDNIIAALSDDASDRHVDEFELCHDLIEVVRPDAEYIEQKQQTMVADGDWEKAEEEAQTYVTGMRESSEMSARQPSLMIWDTRMAWDTANWEVTAEFVDKWGFLLIGCDSLLAATNSWRERRGEKPLAR